MHLLIDNYGVKIEVEDEKFKITLEETTRYASALKIKSINLLSPCSITSPALILAAQHQIPVLIYNSIGKVEAWVWSAYYGNISEIRKAQVYFSDSMEGLDWIKNLLEMKVTNQLQNINYLADRVTKHKEQLIENTELIKKELNKLDVIGNFAQLRGWEGNLSKTYWSSISLALEKHVEMDGREQRQPDDPLNASLNYAYGILYGIVESSLLMTGLDPYMGIMHINRYQRPALAFDQIEPFRPWIDKMIMELFIKNVITPECYNETKTDGILLTKYGRRLIIDNFFALMDERAYLGGKRIKKVDHIHYQSGQLVTLLKKFNKEKK